MDDLDLLTAYARDRSEEAFATLVERYVDLVYSAAHRQLSNPEQARDVVQAVFLMLARKAPEFKRGTILSGWLYRTARFVALEAVRSESRRRRREEAIAQMNTDQEPSPEELWKDVAPHIDAAMEQLNESDRAAVLLRFFHGRSGSELARALGVSEEAAKKRISRALERLRRVLGREGITSSSSMLGAALTAYGIQSAPSAMGGAVSAAICHGSIASAEILSKGALHMIAWTKMKTAVACAAAALLMTGTVTVSFQHARVQQEHERAQTTAATARQSAPDRAEQSRQLLAAAETENRALQKEAQQLHQLRNAVAQLQKQKQTLPIASGKLRLESAPPALHAAAETLRELQFQRFIAEGMKALALKPLTPEEFPTPEYISEINFMKNVGLALRIYATEHKDQYPKSLDPILEGDQLSEAWKKKLRESRYEYHVFTDAELKPNLPAVWWSTPDERGIRIIVMNDGSVQRIREPEGVPTPGLLAAGGAK